MHGLYNTLLKFPYFYQQAQQFLELNSPNQNNQALLSLLVGHGQMIQKLLENQNVLKAQIDSIPRIQTTDTELSRHENDFQQMLGVGQRVKNVVKTVNTILVKQEKQCIAMKTQAKKNGIQIVSICPIQQIGSYDQSESMGYLEQKKQLQRPVQKNKKCCETKNIIKNYGKSILTFLRRNRVLVKKILDLHGYDESQFYVDLEKFKDRVNSITDLKVFWTEQGNNFAKVYRVISNIYLKRYSLKHTFSSRVKNFAVHIKYRKRLLDVLKNPADFSSIKYL